MRLARCIYCLEAKPDSDFNDEHVVPQSFGTFMHNLVLKCVCQKCNQTFGDTFDAKFARDSLEGFTRFRQGLKPIAQYKSFGRKSTTRLLWHEEGPLKGMRLKPRAEGGGGTDPFATEPLPQVGFSRSKDEPAHWFPADQLPTPQDLRELGFEPGEMILRAWEIDWEEVNVRLQANGFPPPSHVEESPAPVGSVSTEWTFVVGQDEYRAVTKIAMNYLAHVGSPAITMMPQFNEARRFVTSASPWKGSVKLRSPLRIKRDDGSVVHGHFVAIEPRGEDVIAQVSILGVLRYVIRLARGPFVIPFCVSSAHVFDLDRNRIFPTDPPPL